MARREPTRSDYSIHNPDCEIAHILSTYGAIEYRKPPVPAVDVHHIFGGHARQDVWCNLISLSREAHRWCHEYPTAGRIVCLSVKKRKRGKDWNVRAMDKCIGKSLKGWLYNTLYCEQSEFGPILGLPDWVVSLGEEIMK